MCLDLAPYFFAAFTLAGFLLGYGVSLIVRGYTMNR